MSYDTFLSYSHSDTKNAQKVKSHLENQGFDVWMDENLRLGDHFRIDIEEAMRTSRSITCLLTESGLKSNAVYEEAERAIATKKRFIPVILDPQKFQQMPRWTSLLRDVNWGKISSESDARPLSDEILSHIAEAIRNKDNRRCPTICVYNFKGGVGKTTLCANLGAQLSELQSGPLSVLMIDCDAQANLSQTFLNRQRLADLTASFRNIVGMLEPYRLHADANQYRANAFIQGGTIDTQVVTLLTDRDGRKLSIIPSSIHATKYGRANSNEGALIFSRFQNALQYLSNKFDAIIIDCNPSATLLSECALYAASDILVPLRDDRFTLGGLDQIDTLLKDIYELDFAIGQNRATRQLWTVVNAAQLKTISLDNRQRAEGNDHEADLLRKIFKPLSGTSVQNISRFEPSLLETRIPWSAYLAARNMKPGLFDPVRLPNLGWLERGNAQRVASAVKNFAAEVHEKTRSERMVLPI